jgi:hypothetical protein
MTLDEEFEQNIRLVVEQLRKCKEAIRQLYVVKDGRIIGLPGAGIKAYQALNFHLTVSSPPDRQLRRMLKWLVRDLPNVKVELENQYYNIVRDSIRIARISDELKLGEQLSSLALKIGKLDEDLCYYAEMAREDQAKSSDLASGGKADLPKEKSGNVNVSIFGDIQARNLQIAHSASIQEGVGTEKKKKGILKKLLEIIGTIIVGIIVAVVTDILGDFGWIERIKTIIQNILIRK